MLTRGAARQREIAVRTALGAARGRIVRQLVTESLLLSALGGVLGAVITVYGVRLLRLGFPDDVPYYIPMAVNVPTLVFAAIVSVIAGLTFGIVPAFRSTDRVAGSRTARRRTWRKRRARAADDCATPSSSESSRFR